MLNYKAMRGPVGVSCRAIGTGYSVLRTRVLLASNTCIVIVRLYGVVRVSVHQRTR